MRQGRGGKIKAGVLAGLALLAVSSARAGTAGQPDPGEDPRITRLWATVADLADDALGGRGTGTADYDHAATMLVTRLRQLGLQPAGTRGFLQPVDLIELTRDRWASSVTLEPAAAPAAGANTGAHPSALPGEPLLQPHQIDLGAGAALVDLHHVPLVFAGYGLSLPDLGHDDFAGLDVRGKLVVVLPGGPATLSGARKADARARRAAWLSHHGALGLISIATPRQTEIPWARRLTLASRPVLRLRLPALDSPAPSFVSGAVNPDDAERLFAGSGHSFAELAALADAGALLPPFALTPRLSVHLVAHQKVLRSANVVARLPGRDPQLAHEQVVVSAHLDGLGRGEPDHCDAIYNGALDNGIGVASALTIAETLLAAPQRPRRSVLFLFPTAEESGLLGSEWFAAHPSVARRELVADINFDMPLPLFPLTSVLPLGADDSTLGDEARVVAQAQGLEVVGDPWPDRNAFIRSDQYSFVRAGVPALFMKIGFKRDTAESDVEKAWRAHIYHSPKDDLAQPVERPVALAFADYVAAVVARVADASDRPAWWPTSWFSHVPATPTSPAKRH